MNESINDEAVYRTAPATPGLDLDKLDGVAPLMTDPPPISSTTLSKKKNIYIKKVM